MKVFKEEEKLDSEKLETLDILPPVPPQMSFSKEEFCGDTFSVDNFVRKHRKDVNLEQLREDLSTYLRSLRLTMIDLINEDYTDFVNLSSNLIGLDKNIANVREPLKAIHDEIASIQTKYETVINQVVQKRQNLYLVRSKKRDLQRIAKADKIVRRIEQLGASAWNDPDQFPLDLLNRFALQISQVTVELECLSHSVPFVEKDLKPKVSILNQRMNYVIENICLRAMNSGDIERFQICVKIYRYTGKVMELERLIIKNVKPVLAAVITSENLEKKDINEYFDNILSVLNEKCSLIIKSNLDPPTVCLNTVWKEIVDSFIVRTPLLFSAGNPDVFHSRFTAVRNFVAKFAHLAGLNEETLLSNEKYRELFEKFNLSVYFHIRYQEMASQFENVLRDENLKCKKQEEKGITSITILSLLDLISASWCSEKIYIPELFHAFWGLTLRFLSRFSNWLKSITVSSVGRSATEHEPCSFILCKLLAETTVAITLVKELFDERILPLKMNICTEEELRECLFETLDTIRNDGLTHIERILKEHLVQQCSEILKQVSDIPRLFRKTNRDAPTKPSAYVSACVDILKRFVTFANEKAYWKTDMTIDILNKLTKNFEFSTTEVLVSVQKMEDSLRRLKKIKGGSVSQKVNSSISDDDKIRLQLQIDVVAYGNLVESELRIPRESVSNLQRLTDLVKNVKNNV